MNSQWALQRPLFLFYNGPQLYPSLFSLGRTSGSLTSYDGNWHENLTLKLNFALSSVFCDYSMLVTLNKIGEVRFRLLGHEWFSCKGKEWKIYCCELALSSEPQIWKFHAVVWQTTSKHCTKMRAACAARLFLFIQPIKSLICGVVVDVAVVKS